MKRIDVAVGVLRDDCGKVLVGQRLVKDRYFQKWEFPGGKLESGEKPEMALKRELAEELAIDAITITPLIRLEHDYPDRLVRLHVFEVNQFSGEPIGYEGQKVQWIESDQCGELDFLAANEPIVNAIQLPNKILITDFERYGLEQVMSYVESLQADNILIQVREPNASVEQLESYLYLFREIAPQSLVLLNGLPAVAIDLGFDGVQLNRNLASQYSQRKELPDFWVGVSCHDQRELLLAEKVGDFALLSPVQKTQSHPGKDVLGWSEFEQLITGINIPCYALGGVKLDDIELVRALGGQGIAAISAYFDLVG